MKKLSKKAERIFVVVGSKTKEELLFTDRFEKLSKKVTRIISATEDGSYGVKGLSTSVAASLLEKEKFDSIYACGPEQMMRQVFDLSEKYGAALEVSLERLMRCAIGICGSCALDDYLVCKDGPVFGMKQLKKMRRIFKKARSGRRIHVTASGQRRTLPDLASIYKITFPRDKDIKEIIREYEKDPNVEFAEPNYINVVHITPNDPAFVDYPASPNQWDLLKVMLTQTGTGLSGRGRATPVTSPSSRSTSSRSSAPGPRPAHPVIRQRGQRNTCTT